MMEVDALTKRFRAKGYAAAARIEGGGVSLEFSKLPPLLRVLLLQDGTVTKTLEAYFWEPVTIITLAQQMDVLGDDVIPGCGADMVVLHRQVEIAGDTSGRLYCLASSLVRTDLLPDSIAARLIAERLVLVSCCATKVWRHIVNWKPCLSRWILTEHHDSQKLFDLFASGSGCQNHRTFPLERLFRFHQLPLNVSSGPVNS
jgi:hypothetical protein